ncbi:MAG: hypothetical protein KDE59_28700 [Anaerolineales bacterium]|nr:hypothetical protein [Anaerolineales bacterium]
MTSRDLVPRAQLLLQQFAARQGLGREQIKRLVAEPYRNHVHNWWRGSTDRPNAQLDVLYIFSRLGLSRSQLDLICRLMEYPAIDLLAQSLGPRELKLLDQILADLSPPAGDLPFTCTDAFQTIAAAGRERLGPPFASYLDDYLWSLLEPQEQAVLTVLSYLPVPCPAALIVAITQEMASPGPSVDGLAGLLSLEKAGILVANELAHVRVKDVQFQALLANRYAEMEKQAVCRQALIHSQDNPNDNQTFVAELFASIEQSPPARRQLSANAPTPDAARRQIHLGEAFVLWTRYHEGREFLVRGLHFLRRRPLQNNVQATLAIIGALAGLSWLHLQKKVSRHWLLPQPDKQLLSRAYGRLVEISYHHFQITQATAYTLLALHAAEQGMESAELAEALVAVGSMNYFLNFQTLAQRQFARADQISQQKGNRSARAYVLLVSATYEISRGGWTMADDTISQLIQIAEKSGSWRRLQDGLQLRILLLHHLGEFQASLAVAGQLEAVAERHQAGRFIFIARFSQAYCHFATGDFGAADAILDELVPLDASLEDKQMQFNYTALRGLIAFRLGRITEAEGYLGKIPTFREGLLVSSFYMLYGYVTAAELALDLRAHYGVDEAAHGDLDKLCRYTLRQLARFARVFPIGRPISLLYEGEWLAQNREYTKADRTWLAGLTAADELKLPWLGLQIQRARRRLPPF